MEAEASPAVDRLMMYAAALSLTALFYLFQKHISGQSLLKYVPRRRVPWGALTVVVAMMMPLMGVIGYFLEPASTEATEHSSRELLLNGWSSFAFMMCFVFGLAFTLKTTLAADNHDFGLPTSNGQFLRDILLGMFATLAALLPIYVIQMALVIALDTNTPHPIVEQLQEHQTSDMLVLSFVLAVIAAPIFEEFTFRCVFQGWLERCEDEEIDFVATERFCSVEPPELATAAEPDAYHKATNLRLPCELAPLPATAPARPSEGWIPDLPHGWTPILISAVLFGLAHLGHGVSPVSLILFGVVLGYLYQRTHRLVPCIAAHMTFNGFSMLMLWVQLQSMSPPQ